MVKIMESVHPSATQMYVGLRKPKSASVNDIVEARSVHHKNLPLRVD